MIKNYLIISIRNIERRKLFSFINIFGLAMGMACCILIFVWCQDELNYERFNKNVDVIYRVICRDYQGDKIFHSALSPNPIGPALQEEYPGVVNSTRYCGGFTNWLVKYGEKTFVNDRFGATEPSFFEIFTFPFLMGDPKTALKNPDSVVITENMAKKYFGTIAEAPDKVIKIGSSDYKVTGVLKNVPHNTHMQFDFLIPIINMERAWETSLKDWSKSAFTTFIQIREDASGPTLSKEITGIIKAHLPGAKGEVYLQPLTDIHLRSNLDWDMENIGKADIADIYLFSLIAVLILIIACINFTNLSTASAGNRAREIGLRKAIGANRTDIIRQFLCESILMAFIALWLSIILCYLFSPIFNSISGKNLTISDFINLPILLELVLLSFLVGIMAGSYPAIIISSFKPIKVLKESRNFKARGSGVLFKTLVGTQLVLTIILILTTIVVYSQLHFIRNKDLGYDKKLLVHMQGQGIGRYFEAFKNALLQNPNIQGVTIGSFPDRAIDGDPSFYWEGRSSEDKTLLYPLPVGYDYLNTLKIKLVEGRFFSKEFPTDAFGFVLNETAVKVMGLKSPVGKRIRYTGFFSNRTNPEGTIIGVVKDFHVESLHHPIKPFVLLIAPRTMWIYARVNSTDVTQAIDFLKSTWKKYSPVFPLSYEFLDETLDRLYLKDRRLGEIFKYFTILAIFIAGLGLYGLSSFMSIQRTKEIGIRKALGSSVFDAVMLLLKEFAKWVLIAMAISLPVGWFVSHKWLQNFAFRTNVEWWMLLFSGGLAMLITLSTVIYSTMKVARTNPADTLRYE
jgi:putative ABC transport system permease protein